MQNKARKIWKYKTNYVFLQQKPKQLLFQNVLHMDVGDRIPEVLGIDQYGNNIKATDFAGRKLILYSYPKANTS